MRTFRVMGYRDIRVPYEVTVEAEFEDDVTDERVGVALADARAEGDADGDREVVDEQIVSVVEVDS